jgi:hypothetical protein
VGVRLTAKGQATRERIVAAAADLMFRPELPATADPDRLGVALPAAVPGGLVLAQVERSPASLEAALDTVLDHIADLAERVAT